jgi:hypothetical protein
MRKLTYPIDSVSPDGSYATSFSYYRLDKLMPGYGYSLCDDESFVNECAPKDTGLFLIDTKNDRRKLILSLNFLANLYPLYSMRNARHYVTHSLFSPDGKYIAFLHRWIHNDPNKRYSRLITCKLDGSDIHISPNDNMFSHYVWCECGILSYCRISNIDGYYIFKNNKLDSYYRIALKLNSDGHPSFIQGTNSFITDTYPDKNRFAYLYKVDIDNEEIIMLAKIKSPKEFQTPDCNHHCSCDLHPRISPMGNTVCFDSVHTGKRSMCFMEL